MIGRSMPTPFVGETLFSFISRVYLRGSFKSPSHLLHEIGVLSSRSLASPFGGHWLPGMHRAFPELQAVLSRGDAVWRHTIAPLLLAFSEGCNAQDRRTGFEMVAWNHGGWRAAPRSSSSVGPEGMRLCAACCEQDIRDVGVPYWHREHQSRLVTLCWRHGTRLKVHLPGIGKGYGLDLPSPDTDGESLTEVIASGTVRADLEQRVARMVVAVLDAPEWSEPALVHRNLTDAASTCGLLNRGRPSWKKIWALMVNAYGEDYLESVGLPTRYTIGVAKRYVRPFWAGIRRLDAAVVILVAAALDVDSKFLCGGVRRNRLGMSQDDRQGDCLESDPSEELEHVLVSSGYVLDRAKKTLGINRHRLVQRIIRAGIKCPVVQGANAKFSEKEIREMIKMLREGTPRDEIQGRYFCNSSFLDQLAIYDPSLRHDAKRSRHERTRAENRKAVMRLVGTTTNVRRDSLWRSLPGPMSFLDRHDKSWLRDVLDKLPRQSGAVRPPPSAGRGKADDDEFDRSTLARLQSVRLELETLTPPRRVTATLAFRLAGVPLTVFEKLGAGRMPQTEAHLREIAEPEDAYVRRKLRYAMQQVAATRNTLTATSLRLASGFIPEKLDEYRHLIVELAEEAGLPINARTTRWAA
jgi:hypothetical protein